MSDEGRRFFRYVLPGLVFFIETLLFAYIILPAQTICFVDQHFTDLGPVVSAFLISGGLGYMFGAVHRFVHWYFPCEEKIFNHQKVIKQLLELKLLELLKAEGLERVGLKKPEDGNVEYLSRSVPRKEMQGCKLGRFLSHFGTIFLNPNNPVKIRQIRIKTQ